MVFLPKGARVFKLRVKDNAGHEGIFSTGTDDRSIADDIERMVKGFRTQRKWAYLTAIATKAVKLPNVYDAFVCGGLDAFMARVIAEANDRDIDPLITEWAERAKPKYVTQVRTMIPAGVKYPLSRFRRSELKSLLLALDVGPTTRRKYRVALSDFAKDLIERDILESNPVRDITLPASARPDKALHCLTPAEAKKLVLAQVGEQRAIEAALCGSGAEWQAVERLTKEDIDVAHRLIHARGTKTARFGSFRDRWIEVTEDWAWDILVAWSATVLPGARLFTKNERRTLWWHNRTAALIRLPKTTLHQYRHTFAKMWVARGVLTLRPDGRDLAWAKNQLGHAPESTLFLDTYAVDIQATRLTAQQQSRLQRPDATSATALATASRKRMKA